MDADSSFGASEARTALGSPVQGRRASDPALPEGLTSGLAVPCPFPASVGAETGHSLIKQLRQVYSYRLTKTQLPLANNWVFNYFFLITIKEKPRENKYSFKFCSLFTVSYHLLRENSFDESWVCRSLLLELKFQGFSKNMSKKSGT